MSDGGNGLVGREAFLDGPARRHAEVNIDGFGTVRLQSLSEREQSRYETSSMDPKTARPEPRRLESSRRRLIALCVVNAKGERILSGADVGRIGDMDGRVANTLHDACLKHCGIGQDEPPEKNDLPATTAAGSPTG